MGFRLIAIVEVSRKYRANYARANSMILHFRESLKLMRVTRYDSSSLPGWNAIIGIVVITVTDEHVNVALM